MLLTADSKAFLFYPLFISLLLLSSHLLFFLLLYPLLSFSPSPFPSLPPSSLAAVCSPTCERSITFQTPPCTVQLTEISSFAALLFCGRGADKEERGLLWEWPFFSFFFSFRDKQKHAKALAWLKRIICRHECKICTRDFFPLNIYLNKKTMYKPSADLLSLKKQIFQEYLKCLLNAYSKLILNVHVFVCVLQYFSRVVPCVQFSCKTTHNYFLSGEAAT